METTIKRLNGVAVDRLTEIIEAVKADAALGEAHFRARNRWVNGAHNRSSIQGFYAAGQEDDSRKEPFVFDNDEPPLLLGDNLGANPVEYLLHGLAGCITTTFVFYAAAQGIELEEVESTLEGDIDLQGLLGIAPVTPGFSAIRVSFRVRSPASDAELESLIRLAQSRSPVTNTVMRAVPVSVDLKRG